MKEIGKRLITFRNSIGYSKQSDFLQEIHKRVGLGISQGNLSHWESEKHPPDSKKLDLLKKAFPELNIHWLFSGEGEMLIKNSGPKIEDQEIELHPAYRRLEKKYLALLEKVNELKK